MRNSLFILSQLFFVLFVLATAVKAQNSPITLNGKVLDSNGTPIPYATVSVKNTINGTTTNDEGAFSIAIEADENILLLIRCIGYEESEINIQATKLPKSQLTIVLGQSTTSLAEVAVYEKSKTTKRNELPYAITAIDTKPLQIRNLDVNGILGTVTGVKIREKGGLGSGFEFSLNGFSGNQIKFFIDGIPMDNFGSSLTLNNIPVNLISSFEVYKGVIPVELGIDALGGAVNIVTNQNTKKFLDFSYSLGSFNTHRVSLVSRYTFPKSGIQLNANAFYNYSDNDYKIWAEVPDPETGSVGTPELVRRFHDAYHSATAQLEIGVVGKKYADKLFLGVMASSNYKEVQTGYNMSKVAGEVYTTSDRLILSLKYAKDNLWLENLDAHFYATYIDGTDLVADTSSNIYDWYGNYTTKEFGTSGELNWYKTLFRFNDKSTMNTANVAYQLFPGHAIAINNTFVYFDRVGEDPIGYYAVPFSKPNKISKNITGLSYNQNLFNGKLKSSAFAKFFFMDANMYERVSSGTDEVVESVNNTFKNSGFGIATSYFILPGLQAKASFENTYRLPETVELFGDGLSLLSSPNLLPEQSKNLNLGITWRKQMEQSNFAVETSYLYRLPKNLIRLVAEGTRAWYENYTNAKTNCIEADIKYSYKNKFRINVNGTYQNIVDNLKTTETGADNYLYGDRLPNIPYLFGNASAGYQFLLFGNAANKASIDWNTHFVESFYLKSPSQGAVGSKYVIPQQVSHNLSLSFLFSEGRYNVSLACTNLTNNELYDNFRLQKPGRAFSIKLRYFISEI